MFERPAFAEASAGKAEGSTVFVRLYTVDGKLVAEETTKGWGVKFSVRDLAAGLYLWTARTSEKRIGSGVLAVLSGQR